MATHIRAERYLQRGLIPTSGAAFLHHLPLTLFLLANVPVVAWYMRRTTDGSDEPLGLVALAAAMWFLWRQRREISLQRSVLCLGALILCLAQVLLLHRAPLALGALSILTIASAMRSQNSRSGIVALLLLSLPLLASLDFYAGYPMRLATAEISARLLQLFGIDVVRAGVLLQHKESLIGVDPPCAGVRMLWTGLFVSAFLAARQRAGAWHTLTLLFTAVACVLLGNALRAAILFFPESGIVGWPHWTHEAIGLGMQAVLLGGLLFADARLARTPRAPASKHGVNQVSSARLPTPGMCARFLVVTSFAVCCGMFWMGHSWAAASQKPALDESRDKAEIWPVTFDGVPLERLSLSAREDQFTRSFPGAIARFRCGDAEIIMRHATQATRRLHSSADCLRAMGYQINHEPVYRDPDGRIWGCFRAVSAGASYIVTERITSIRDADRSFTDVSAWYWNAVWHPGEGPWLAISVMRPPSSGQHQR
ncbi:MAG: exosortase/archaeosortase family protein [Roseimicrobium sp.]